MVMEEKLLDLAKIMLLQYKSCSMSFLHVVQNLPASPQPSTTLRSARFTTVQPEKYKKIVYILHQVITYLMGLKYLKQHTFLLIISCHAVY
jgi:hypothetical protein